MFAFADITRKTKVGVVTNMASRSFDFSGKRALVTGAGKGIGRATVKALVECGAEVVALSRTKSDLDSLKKEVNGIKTVCVDLQDLKSTLKEVESIGPIHLLVNNAAVAMLQPFLEVTEEAYDISMSINVKAVLFLTQAVVKGMVERGEKGSIVNISSQASMCALRDHAVYCSSKGAVDMLTAVMGLELGKHGIRVNTVNPTVVLTAMGKIGWSDPKKAGPMLEAIPMKKFAEVEDVVNAILFLLSDDSAMINCTKLPVDGGFHAC